MLEYYEKALLQVLNHQEAKKKCLEDSLQSLINERNTAQQHVANMQTALKDIHQYVTSTESMLFYHLNN